MGNFNVYGSKKYRWTVSTRSESLIQVPWILLEEYRQDLSSLLQTFKRYSNLVVKGLIPQILQAGQDVLSGVFYGGLGLSVNPKIGIKDLPYNPYESIYKAQGPLNTYVFPWYDSYHHVINNTWENKSGSIESKATEYAADQLSRFISPAAGFDTAKAWRNIDEASFPFEFSLINTDFTDEKDFKQGVLNHINLIETLVLANLPMRDGFATMLPPCIYRMSIPGVRDSPACVFSTLEINNVGQLNKLNISGKGDYIIPDEWKIRIVLTELIKESNLIYMGIVDPSQKVTAISTNSTLIPGKVSNQLTRSNLDQQIEATRVGPTQFNRDKLNL